MLKRSFKLPILPSIGIALYNIVFKNMSGKSYNETYPPILIQAGFYFCLAYITIFLISLLIEWVRLKAEIK